MWKFWEGDMIILCLNGSGGFMNLCMCPNSYNCIPEINFTVNFKSKKSKKLNVKFLSKATQLIGSRLQILTQACVTPLPFNPVHSEGLSCD